MAMSSDEWDLFKEKVKDGLKLGKKEFVPPPKVVHAHKLFGQNGEVKDFTKDELLQGLLSSARTMPSALTFYNVGQFYWYQMGDRENALNWLGKAAVYNNRDAIDLIRKINVGNSVVKASAQSKTPVEVAKKVDSFASVVLNAMREKWKRTRTCPFCHKNRLNRDFVYCPMCGKRLP